MLVASCGVEDGYVDVDFGMDVYFVDQKPFISAKKFNFAISGIISEIARSLKALNSAEQRKLFDVEVYIYKEAPCHDFEYFYGCVFGYNDGEETHLWIRDRRNWGNDGVEAIHAPRTLGSSEFTVTMFERLAVQLGYKETIARINADWLKMVYDVNETLKAANY